MPPTKGPSGGPAKQLPTVFKQAIKDAKNASHSSGGQTNKLAFSLLLVSFVLPPAVACGLAYAKTTSDDAFLESVSEIATTWSGLVVVVSTSNILRHGWARSKGCVCGALRWSVIKKLVRASLRGSLACSVRFTLRLGQACGRTALFALSVAGLPSEVLLDKHPWLEEPFSLARAVLGSFFVVYGCLWCLKEYVFKWRHVTRSTRGLLLRVKAQTLLSWMRASEPDCSSQSFFVRTAKGSLFFNVPKTTTFRDLKTQAFFRDHRPKGIGCFKGARLSKYRLMRGRGAPFDDRTTVGLSW